MEQYKEDYENNIQAKEKNEKINNLEQLIKQLRETTNKLIENQNQTDSSTSIKSENGTNITQEL